MTFRGELKSVSLFAETAVSVQRVVTQLTMEQEQQDQDVTPGKVSLSPPSQSSLMLKRRALYNSQSASRLKACAPLIEVTHQ